MDKCLFNIHHKQAGEKHKYDVMQGLLAGACGEIFRSNGNYQKQCVLKRFEGPKRSV